jgi:hypothetical protein
MMRRIVGLPYVSTNLQNAQHTGYKGHEKRKLHVFAVNKNSVMSGKDLLRKGKSTNQSITKAASVCAAHQQNVLDIQHFFIQ